MQEPQYLRLVLRLHAFRDRLELQRPRKRDDRRHDGGGAGVIQHRDDEGAIDLQCLHGQLGEIRQRRVPRAEIIERDLNSVAPDRRELLNVLRHVLHQQRFGHLDIDPGLRAGQPENRRDRAHEIIVSQLDRGNIHRHARRLAISLEPAGAVGTSLAQRPGSGLDDESGLFHDRDELRRRHQPQLGVLPAHQRFDAGQAPVQQIDFRLVVQHELFVFQAAPDLVLQRQPLGDALTQTRRIEDMPRGGVARLLQRSLSVAQQALGVGAVGRIQRNAGFGGHVDLVTADLQGRSRPLTPPPLQRALQCVVRANFGDDGGELIGTDSRHHG